MKRTIFALTLFGTFLGMMVSMSAQPGKPTVDELQKDVNNLKELDPNVAKYLPRWRILEADLKTKLTLYFRSRGYDMKTSDTIVVTAGFDTQNGQQDIQKIEVREVPGAELNGRQSIQTSLGEALYQDILAKEKYAHADIEREIPLTQSEKTRVPSVLYPTNARQFVAISAFRQAVQVGSTGARVEHLIGSDEVGYPFWSGGQGKVLVDYPIIRQDNEQLRANGVPDPFMFSLGVGYRLKFGAPGQSALSDVFSPRLLNGAIGAKAIVRAEYRFPQLNDLGIGFYTEIPFNKRAGSESVTGNEEVVWVPDSILTTRPNIPIRTAYFMRTVAQGNLFWETWLDNYEHYVRFSLGMSYQEFASAALRVDDYYLDPSGDSSRRINDRGTVEIGPGGLANNVDYRGLVHPTEVQDWLYAKVEYLNQSDFPFGASAQLSNRNLLLTGFVPVVPNWLFLQAKYSTPLLRDEAAPWENKPFIVVSPILRFMLD